MKFSKTILVILIFILPFLGTSLFLKSEYYFNFLRNQNGPSYFYLSYDWMKKIQLAMSLSNENMTLILGSSRSAYTFDQKYARPNLLNLSLMAASYNEIELLSKAMSFNQIKAKKIYLELNPTSATLRHIKAMSVQSSDDIFGPYLANSPTTFIKRQLHKLSIYMNHSILRDAITQYFLEPNDIFDSYKKMKRAEHVKEFHEMNSSMYRGFLSSMKNSLEHYDRAFNECSTMLNWIMSNDDSDDMTAGLSKFDSMIANLQRVAPEIIVWIPPSPPAKKYAAREELIINKLKMSAIKHNLKVIDLRAKLKLTDNDFFDCVHPDEHGAQILSNTLFKN